MKTKKFNNLPLCLVLSFVIGCLITEANDSGNYYYYIPAAVFTIAIGILLSTHGTTKDKLAK